MGTGRRIEVVYEVNGVLKHKNFRQAHDVRLELTKAFCAQIILEGASGIEVFDVQGDETIGYYESSEDFRYVEMDG